MTDGRSFVKGALKTSNLISPVDIIDNSNEYQKCKTDLSSVKENKIVFSS